MLPPAPPPIVNEIRIEIVRPADGSDNYRLFSEINPYDASRFSNDENRNPISSASASIDPGFITMDRQVIETLREILDVGALPTDWDEDGAVSPNAVVGSAMLLAIEAAWKLTAYGRYSVPTTVAPIVDGTIQLEWEVPKSRIEVIVERSGDYSYVLLTRENGVRTARYFERRPASEVLDAISSVVAGGD